jgi:hypothetical protein
LVSIARGHGEDKHAPGPKKRPPTGISLASGRIFASNAAATSNGIASRFGKTAIWTWPGVGLSDFLTVPAGGA